MAGGIKGLKQRLADLEERLNRPRPLLRYHAPAGDPEAAELFAAARAGDAAAVARLPAFLRERDWVEWVGDIGAQATRQLVRRAAGGDPVLEAGLAANADDLRGQLAGGAPSVLESLLVRRVVNGWLATHCAEIELASAIAPDARRRLEALLGKSERRMASAVRELAVVRRLEAPALMARLEVAAAGAVSRPALPAAGVQTPPM